MSRIDKPGGELHLVFLDHTRDEIQNDFRVDWSSGKPVTWAALGAGVPQLVSRLGTALVEACMPPNGRVCFSALSEREGGHEYLKRLLGSAGEHSEERRQVRGRKHESHGFWDLIRLMFKLGRGDPNIVSILLACTQDTKVIEQVFDQYEFEWWSLFLFPFMIVSDPPPSDWRDLLADFSTSPKPQLLTTQMIKKSVCIIITEWEHGVELISDKISPVELEEIARRVANQISLPLVVEQ